MAEGTVKKTIEIPVDTWAEIEKIAGEAGVTPEEIAADMIDQTVFPLEEDVGIPMEPEGEEADEGDDN